MAKLYKYFNKFHVITSLDGVNINESYDTEIEAEKRLNEITKERNFIHAERKRIKKNGLHGLTGRGKLQLEHYNKVKQDKIDQTLHRETLIEDIGDDWVGI